MKIYFKIFKEKYKSKEKYIKKQIKKRNKKYAFLIKKRRNKSNFHKINLFYD